MRIRTMFGTRITFLVAVSAHALGLANAAGIRGCPSATSGFATHDKGSKAISVNFRTKSENPLDVYWVDSKGLEQFVGSCDSVAGLDQNTALGHAFRVYATGDKEDRSLVLEFVVEKDAVVDVVLRQECLSDANRRKYALSSAANKEEQAKAAEARAERLEPLIHLGPNGEQIPPCKQDGMSHLWSCVRRVPADECESRHKNVSKVTEGNAFGFDKPMGRWKVGSYEDEQYDWQMPRIPQLSDGPGFLLMNMTDALRTQLLPWFKQKWASQTGVRVESPVPGGYLNDHWVASSHVDIHTDRKLTSLVQREMHDVLQWWTGDELRHTSTFGVRVYHRGNVLLNHVDRYDTHLASAILQVHQNVDKNSGWPLEVLSESRDCYEIYLQPGQMVLYEGAHFKHGRPMTFRGGDFGNLFVHFAPKNWHGPDMNAKLEDETHGLDL